MTTPNLTDKVKEALEDATPGPWRVSDLWERILTIEDARRTVTLCQLNALRGDTKGESNARLIALAPAMARHILATEERLRAVRNEALEEAARLAEDFPKTYEPKPPEGRKRFTCNDLSAYSKAACRMVGEDIRELKKVQEDG